MAVFLVMEPPPIINVAGEPIRIPTPVQGQIGAIQAEPVGMDFLMVVPPLITIVDHDLRIGMVVAAISQVEVVPEAVAA